MLVPEPIADSNVNVTAWGDEIISVYADDDVSQVYRLKSLLKETGKCVAIASQTDCGRYRYGGPGSGLALKGADPLGSIEIVLFALLLRYAPPPELTVRLIAWRVKLSLLLVTGGPNNRELSYPPQ
jgi:hypothetical protein